MQTIINNLLLAETDKEIDSAMKAIREEMDKANPEQKVMLRSIISAKVKMMSKEADRLIAESQSLISTPEFVIDLNEWITMKEYTKRFQLSSTNVVSNWIKRGLVPPSNIRVLPMLNNLKLIKAVKYL
jgi:uncharacterized membrane protein (DUF106 family)